jgi:hypothetical protein
MNAEQFEDLTKTLALVGSRRSAVKALIGAAAGGILASVAGGAVRIGAQALAQTSLKLTNNSGSDVQAYITLGVPPGCVSSVAKLPFVTNVVNSLQGWFTLKSGSSITYTPPAGQCLNGNIAFGTPPLNCPTAQFPNGINLAEFILNNAGGAPFAQETIDDSAVAGVNAGIRFVMTGGGAWNAGSAYPNVTSFQNQSLRANAGLVGVYPWGCDNCTVRSAPPVCSSPYDGSC